MLAARARLLAETGRWPECRGGCGHRRQQHPDHGRREDSRAGGDGCGSGAPAGAGGDELLDEALALALPHGGEATDPPGSPGAIRARLARRAGRTRPAPRRKQALRCLNPTDSFWDRERLHLLEMARCRWTPRTMTRPARMARRLGPHGLSLRGDWRAAADAWERLWMPVRACGGAGRRRRAGHGGSVSGVRWRSAPARRPIACARISAGPALRGCGAGLARARARIRPG